MIIQVAALTFALLIGPMLFFGLIWFAIHLADRRRARLTASQQSISTPLGHVPYRQVNTHASLDEGVQRARNRCYVRGDE